MFSEKVRRSRNEQNWFVICGLTGMVGIFFWTENIWAMIAFGGLAALIGEGISTITRRLDQLIENGKPQ